MNAGRELDALIAEKVMGIACAHHPVPWTRDEVIADVRADFLDEYGVEAPPKWVGDADSILHSDYPPYKCAKCGEKRISSRLRSSSYSTDLASAWTVVVKLQTAGFGVSVADTPAGYEVTFDHIESGTCSIRDGATLPLAICRAALGAVEVPA